VFQILRIYRLIIAIPATRELIVLILRNSSGISNLVLFVFLITFLVSIFAVQLFCGELTPSNPYGNVIYTTFFTIYNTFLGVYQILSSENWTINLYNITAFDTALNNCMDWYNILHRLVHPCEFYSFEYVYSSHPGEFRRFGG